MSSIDHHLRIAICDQLGTDVLIIDDAIIKRLSRTQHGDASETIFLDGNPILRFWLPELRFEGNKVICEQRFAKLKQTED